MDLATVERETMEGKRPSEAALQRAISNVETDSTPTTSTIIAEVGRNHPAYLARFAEQLGNIGYVEDEFHLDQIITGVSAAIESDPSVFEQVDGLLRNAIAYGQERTLQSVFQSIGTAADAGAEIPDLLVQMAALRIAVSRGGPPVQSGASMFERLVKAERANNTEAFDLVVGLVETGRGDLVEKFGNVLVDLILQEEVPNGADVEAAKRVLAEFQGDLTVPSVDVRSALNMLES